MIHDDAREFNKDREELKFSRRRSRHRRRSNHVNKTDVIGLSGEDQIKVKNHIGLNGEQWNKFKKLAEGLPAEQQIAYYQALQEAGIAVTDNELAKLLKGLQIYKAFYETIPANVESGAERIARVKTEIEELADHVSASAEASEKALDRVLDESVPFNDALEKIHSHIEQAAEKASNTISDYFRKRLLDAMNQAMPIAAIENSLKYILQMADSSKLIASGMKDEIVSTEKAVSDLRDKISDSASAASDSIKKAGETLQTIVKDTSDHLRKSAKIIRWKQTGVFAIASVAIILAIGYKLHINYEMRLDRARTVVISQIEENREILRSLSKSNHKLEMTSSGSKKLLIMKNAKGWVTEEGWGVIEFKE